MGGQWDGLPTRREGDDHHNGTAPTSSGPDQYHLQSATLAHVPGLKASDSDAERGLKLDDQIPNRAALPKRQANRSQSSLPRDTSSPQNGAISTEIQVEHYSWGPSHPCFPHRNPHVPLSSPLYHSTRIIRIKRDWMIAGDLAPTFSNLYPEILEAFLTEREFRQIIKKLNTELVEIFSPWSWRNWLDLVLGILTLWAWEDFGLTNVKRRLSNVETWLQRWNTEYVSIVPLRRTAYMSVRCPSINHLVCARPTNSAVRFVA